MFHDFSPLPPLPGTECIRVFEYVDRDWINRLYGGLGFLGFTYDGTFCPEPIFALIKTLLRNDYWFLADSAVFAREEFPESSWQNTGFERVRIWDGLWVVSSYSPIYSTNDATIIKSLVVRSSLEEPGWALVPGTTFPGVAQELKVLTATQDGLHITGQLTRVVSPIIVPMIDGLFLSVFAKQASDFEVLERRLGKLFSLIEATKFYQMHRSQLKWSDSGLYWFREDEDRE